MDETVGAGFPREVLSAGEQVLLEVKPSFTPFLLAPIGSLSFLLAMGGVLVLWGAARGLAASFAIICGGLLVFLLPVLGLGAVVGYFRWKATYYALTDRRAIVRTGIIGSTLTDAPHHAIQNVTMVQNAFQKMFGYGTVILATSGVGGAATMPRPSAARLWSSTTLVGGDVVFYGVRDPVGLRRRCQELMEQATERAKERDYRKMADAFAERGQAPMPPRPPVVVTVPAPPRKPAKFCEFCGAGVEGTPTYCAKCGGRVN